MTPPVLTVGDLGDQRRDPPAGQVNGPQALGLVVGLHLAHELGVAALGLDDRDDAGRVAVGVCADEPVRQVRALHAAAAGLFHGVFLDQHPLVAAVKQGADKLVGHIGLVGQRHLGRGESPDPPERLQAEGGSEVVLPGTHVQPVILDRRRWRHRVAPGGTEPLGGLAGPAVVSKVSERVEHLAQAHLPHSVQQGARVVEHHPGLAAFTQELGDELAHAPIAPREHRGVVAVTDVRMLHHPRQVADDPRGAQVVARGRDERLMHVQRHRERAGGALDVHTTRKHRALPARLDGLADQRLLPTQAGQTIDVPGHGIHGLASRWH